MRINANSRTLPSKNDSNMLYFRGVNDYILLRLQNFECFLIEPGTKFSFKKAFYSLYLLYSLYSPVLAYSPVLTSEDF
jgi:hypothetical protein